MSEQEENNTCPTCGGAKMVRYEVEIIYPGTRPKVNPVPSTAPFKLCTCPLPKPKHDGKLDPDGDYTVRIWNGKGLPFVHIEGPGVNGYTSEDMAQLTPKQALSLLDWLSQNRAKLEDLAREEDKQ